MAFEFKRIITDEEEKILKHDLLDPVKWINDAIDGKIRCVVENGAKEYRNKLIQENQSSMPTSDFTAFAQLLGRSDYKNRAQREQEINSKK